jgi:hypothetical protein
MPPTANPYSEVARLLNAAGEEAARRADHDERFPSPWANAEMAIQLAITGLPDPGPGDDRNTSATASTDCLGLVVHAISVLDHVESDQRRPEHSLDLGYAVAAADEVRRALSASPGFD